MKKINLKKLALATGICFASLCVYAFTPDPDEVMCQTESRSWGWSECTAPDGMWKRCHYILWIKDKCEAAYNAPEEGEIDPEP